MGSDIQNSTSRNNAGVSLNQGAIPLVEPIRRRGDFTRGEKTGILVEEALAASGPLPARHRPEPAFLVH
jgi:hypothetical protein